MTEKNQTPAQLAGSAADSVRALNHATFSSRDGGLGWEYACDAYDVIGGLDRMAGGLAQALNQVSHLLYDLESAGRVISTKGAHETASEVLTARTALRKAELAAQELTSALSRAHSATSSLATS